MVDTTRAIASQAASARIAEDGAPVITPEMIEAGMLEFALSDSRIEGMDDVLPRVFRAMWRAR